MIQTLGHAVDEARRVAVGGTDANGRPFRLATIAYLPAVEQARLSVADGEFSHRRAPTRCENRHASQHCRLLKRRWWR